jgi:uncharacterized protein
MVRAHVQASRGLAAEAGAYLAAALRFLRPAPPVLIAAGGLPGTGKSRLAHALAPRIGAAPGALVLASDVLRKRRHGVSPETRLPDAAYTPEENRAVFATLTESSAKAVGLGHAVIADATFLDPENRTAIEAAARAACVPFLGLWLEAPLAELEGRVKARAEAPEPDPSDATASVLLRMAASAQGALPPGWHRLDASGPAEATLARAAQLAEPWAEPC